MNVNRIVIALLISFVGLLWSHSAMAAERPNIMLVFIDDMGWGDFSCFGSKDVDTKHIDRMASQGIRFEQFYVNSPICSPSRTAISTGQYPQRWRISSYLAHRQINDERGMAQWLDLSAPMLARFLHQAGYATGHFGKWHMGGQRDVAEAPAITEYGFDASLTNFEGMGPKLLPLADKPEWNRPRKIWQDAVRLGEPVTWMRRSKITSGFVARALAFIDEAQADGKPFYINVWPDDVHGPWFPPVSKWGNGEKRTLYQAVLKEMDNQFALLFDRICGDPKLRYNTLMLICSDNGPEPGAGTAGPLRGFKTQLFEGGVRSPLIVWGPGLVDQSKAGSVNRDSVFAAIDLVPSLLEIAGVKTPAEANFDGEALPDVLLGKSTASRQAMLFFRRPPDRDAFYGVDDLPDLAVRDGNWKLLCEYDGSDAMLYDLAVDAGETNNLVDKQPQVVERLTKAVLAWNQSLPPDNGATYQGRGSKKQPGK